MIHEMQDVKTDGILHHQHFPIAHKAQLWVYLIQQIANFSLHVIMAIDLFKDAHIFIISISTPEHVGRLLQTHDQFAF
jgi:hypothetical protein